MRGLLIGSIAIGLLAGPVVGDTSGPLGGWNGSTFDDVKTPQMANSGFFGTQWAMHVTYAFTNYAGFLFELQYDGNEMSHLTLTPAGPHVGLEVPTAFLLKTQWTFAGGQTSPQTVPWIGAWIDPAAAQASGITLSASQLVPLFSITGHITNTASLNNSDIDITLNAWQIQHIVNTESFQIQASDWLYLTRFGNGFQNDPGHGRWFHQSVATTIQIPASFFVATNDFVQNAAGFGIEHAVPAPAAWAVIASGLGLGVLARRRRRP